MASIRSWLAGDDVSVVSVRSWLDSHGGRPEASVITWLSSYQSADGSHDGDGHMMSCGISDAASWLAVEASPSVWLGVEEHMDHMGHMVRAFFAGWHRVLLDLSKRFAASDGSMEKAGVQSGCA